MPQERESKYLVLDPDLFYRIQNVTYHAGYHVKTVREYFILDRYFDTCNNWLTSPGSVYRLRGVGHLPDSPKRYLGTFKEVVEGGRHGSVHIVEEIEHPIGDEQVQSFLGHSLYVPCRMALFEFFFRNNLKGPLTDLVTIQNHRISIDFLRFHHRNTHIEVSLDDVVYTDKAKSASTRLIEAEFKEGDYMDYLRFLYEFEQRFGLTPCDQNKVQVGLGLLCRL